MASPTHSPLAIPQERSLELPLFKENLAGGMVLPHTYSLAIQDGLAFTPANTITGIFLEEQPLE